MVAPKDSVCKMTTRLGLILPSMPDIGEWRVETHSYYSANEIAASVDVIRSAVGPKALVPLTVRIEQRTPVAQGKTKHFPVVVVELRGATAGEILAASMGVKELSIGPPERKAIGAARPDYVAQAKAAVDIEEWREVWNSALAAGHLDDQLKAELAEVGKTLAPPKPIPSATPNGEVDAEIIDDEADDPDEVDREYAAIINNCPDGWDMTRLNREFALQNGGTTLSTGTVAELRAFRAWPPTGGAAQ